MLFAQRMLSTVRRHQESSCSRQMGGDATERAELWAAIHDTIPLDDLLEWRETTTETCGRIRVPAVVAADGTAAMATFLATYGFENGEIADGLGVGARTVSQYISDFRKGER